MIEKYEKLLVGQIGEQTCCVSRALGLAPRLTWCHLFFTLFSVLFFETNKNTRPYILKANKFVEPPYQSNKMAQKRPKITQNGPKWPKYDPRWPKNDPKWPEMTQNDPKWPKIAEFAEISNLFAGSLGSRYSLLECMHQAWLICLLLMK